MTTPVKDIELSKDIGADGISREGIYQQSFMTLENKSKVYPYLLHNHIDYSDEGMYVEDLMFCCLHKNKMVPGTFISLSLS